MNNDGVIRRFEVYKLEDVATRNWIAQMRRTYAEAAREISIRLPPTREREMALTKLEEAMFWTSAAAARANGQPVGFGYDTALDSPDDPLPKANPKYQETMP